MSSFGPRLGATGLRITWLTRSARLVKEDRAKWEVKSTVPIVDTTKRFTIPSAAIPASVTSATANNSASSQVAAKTRFPRDMLLTVEVTLLPDRSKVSTL